MLTSDTCKDINFRFQKLLMHFKQKISLPLKSVLKKKIYQLFRLNNKIKLNHFCTNKKPN